MMEGAEEERDRKRPSCSDCDETVSTKKQKLPLMFDFHHPLFDYVDATGENEMLPTIHILNNECMDMVLSYFSIVKLFRLGKVCRRWYNMCLLKISRIDNIHLDNLQRVLNEEFWGKRDIEHWLMGQKPNQLSMMNLQSIVSLNFRSLTTLSLTNVDGLNSASFSILIEMMRNLTNLELILDKLDKNTCKVMSEMLIPKLEALSLDVAVAPDNASLRKMVSSAKSLKFLRLADVKNEFDPDHEDDPWYDPFDDDLEGLEEINVEDSGVIKSLPPTLPLEACSFYGLKLHPKSLEFILRNFCDTLQYLNLSNTNLEELYTDMQTENIPKLEKMKVFLASVRLDVYRDLPNRCFLLVAVLKLMPNLRFLDLTKNYHLRNNGYDILKILSENCPLLEELHLAKCAIQAENLDSLAKLKYLKRLILGEICEQSWNHKGPDMFNLVDCFKFITHHILTQMENLEELCMEDPYHPFSADDIVSFIENAGPKFKTLTLCCTTNCFMARRYRLDVRHNYIEEAVRKCKERSKGRDTPIKILVHGLGYLHRNDCDTEESSEGCSCNLANYDDISPKFLSVKDVEFTSDSEFRDYFRFYPHNISMFGSIKINNGFCKVPCFDKRDLYFEYN